MIGFVFFKYSNNAKDADSKQSEIALEDAKLTKFAIGLKKQEELEKENSDAANPIITAVHGRTQYIEIFNKLNKLLKNDKIWFVQIEPLYAGAPLKDTDKLGEEDISNSFSKPKASKKGAADPNCNNSPEVVWNVQGVI